MVLCALGDWYKKKGLIQILAMIKTEELRCHKCWKSFKQSNYNRTKEINGKIAKKNVISLKGITHFDHRE